MIATLGAALVAPAAAHAGPTQTVGCAQQSFATFDGAFTRRENLVVGPLAWMGARDARSDGALGGGYRWKFPALIRAGHRVALRIPARATAFAGFTYDHKHGWEFPPRASVVRFSACAPAKAGSRADGRRVSFFSGGVVTNRSPACVPVEIRTDGGTVRHRTLALGPGAAC